MVVSLAVTLLVLGAPIAKVAYLTGILAGAGAIGGLPFAAFAFVAHFSSTA